jgi:parafibromin
MSSPDALSLLRSSIAANKPPILTTSSDPSDAESHQTDSLVSATHLFFSHPSPTCLTLSTPTRFESTNPDTTLVNLLSIFFAWQQKDVPVPEYISKSGDLNKELPEGQKVRNLVFVERLDLITWLEGASEDSEYIKPIEGAAGVDGDAARAADVAGGAGVPIAGGTGVGVTQIAGGRPVKVIDARLQAIYNNERRMGDHNTVLRGIKPTVRISPQTATHSPLTRYDRTSLMSADTPKPSLAAAQREPLGPMLPPPNHLSPLGQHQIPANP